MTDTEIPFIRELRQEVKRTALAPTPAHRPQRGARHLMAGTGGLLAVAGSVVALVLSTPGVAPAFTITKRHDGTVAVTLNRLSGINGASRELRTSQLRVSQVVLPPSPGSGKTTPTVLTITGSQAIAPTAADLQALTQQIEMWVTQQLESDPGTQTLTIAAPGNSQTVTVTGSQPSSSATDTPTTYTDAAGHVFAETPATPQSLQAVRDTEAGMIATTFVLQLTGATDSSSSPLAGHHPR
jgi:hypothetical protein